MKPAKPPVPDSLPIKTRLAGWGIAMLVRMVALTLRIRIDDRCGILAKRPEGSLIWAFWHNRILVMPWVYRGHLSDRNGAVLTSASRDGAVLAEVMRNFGVSSVRGSSSRRGGQAMVELVKWIADGHDVVIIPDGPRGPCYHLQPGIVKLAQMTGARIFPILVDYHSYWELKSWDRFRIPKPFSTAVIVFGAYQTVDSDIDGESFEAERLRIEQVLRGNEIDHDECTVD
jgi:lysophospholipid acyltransferase (LPLAT)-like uncharacterized protein